MSLLKRRETLYFMHWRYVWLLQVGCRHVVLRILTLCFPCWTIRYLKSYGGILILLLNFCCWEECWIFSLLFVHRVLEFHLADSSFVSVLLCKRCMNIEQFKYKNLFVISWIYYVKISIKGRAASYTISSSRHIFVSSRVFCVLL